MRNNQLKKYCFVFLFAVLLISLCACKKDKTISKEQVTNTTTESSKEPAVTENENEASTEEASKEEASTGEASTGEVNSEEEITQEETTATSARLSEDPFSFQISFDGKTIQLPCNAADLMAIGYSFDDRADDILEDGYTTSSGMELANGNRISVSLYNISGKSKPFKECMVDDIYLYERNSSGQSIYISNGITYGASSADIKAIYGNQADVYENGDYLYLTYKKEDDNSNKVQFYFNNDSLYQIDVTTRGY